MVSVIMVSVIKASVIMVSVIVVSVIMVIVIMVIVIMVSVIIVSVIMVSVIMVSVIMVTVIMVSVIMLNVVLLNVVMLYVIMVSVVAPKKSENSALIVILKCHLNDLSEDMTSNNLFCNIIIILINWRHFLWFKRQKWNSLSIIFLIRANQFMQNPTILSIIKF